jgi:hypothetical protein
VKLTDYKCPHFSPVSYHSGLLWYKYSLQPPALKHPQSVFFPLSEKNRGKFALLLIFIIIFLDKRREDKNSLTAR